MSTLNIDTIQLPIRTEAEWSATNPVLLEGEFIFVKLGNARKIKAGDGVTAFNNLPYVAGANETPVSPASETILGIVQEATIDEVMQGDGANESGGRLFVNPGKLAGWWEIIKSALTKDDVDLGQVDNTSDIDKPVSTLQALALGARLPLLPDILDPDEIDYTSHFTMDANNPLNPFDTHGCSGFASFETDNYGWQLLGADDSPPRFKVRTCTNNVWSEWVDFGGAGATQVSGISNLQSLNPDIVGEAITLTDSKRGGVFKAVAKGNLKADYGVRFTSTDNTKIWERQFMPNYIDAAWFGVIGDGQSHPANTIINPNTNAVYETLAELQAVYPTARNLTDEIDGLAIQAAINYAIFLTGAGTKDVFIPDGVYRTSDTLHVGYGYGFVSCNLISGKTAPYDSGSGVMKGCTILPQFSDRPAINFQSTRMSSTWGIKVLGKNTTNPGYNNVIWHDPAQYVTAGLHANADSDTAPYVGICVDGWSGASPAIPYPDVNFPVAGNIYGIPALTQYNKPTSSDISINYSFVAGFIAGFVSQPSGADANGDFIRFDHVSIHTCKYGISIGNGQARLTSITNSQIDTCWHLFTTSKHGAKRGRINLIEGTHLSGYQVLNVVESGWNGPLMLRNCYSESLFLLGVFGFNRSAACAIKFEGCEFTFDHSNGVPGFLISTGSVAKISFDTCRMAGALTVAGTRGPFEMDGVSTQIEIGSYHTSVVGNSLELWKNLLQFTGGFAFIGYGKKRMRDCKLLSDSLAGGTFDSYNFEGLGYEDHYSYTNFGDNITGYFGNSGYRGDKGYQVWFRNSGDLIATSVTLSGLVLTIVGLNGQYPHNLIRVGDILQDLGRGINYLIYESTGSGNFKGLMLNGFRKNANGTFSYENGVTESNPVSGNTHFIACSFNRTANYNALIGDATSNSQVITGVINANNEGNASAGMFAGAIDEKSFIYAYVVEGNNPTVRKSHWYGPFSFVSKDTVNFTITLNQNLGVTGRVYFFNVCQY
ncbi:MAG TPA: hypothetical protein VGB63_12995 [Pedobacter sp.]|jgi:hypothetical protein